LTYPSIIRKAVETALKDWVNKKRLLDQDRDERVQKVAKMFSIEKEDEDEEKLKVLPLIIIHFHFHYCKRAAKPFLSQKTEESKEEEKPKEDEKKESIFKSHVPVPSQEEIQKYLLERKKQILLEKYVSEDLTEKEKETRELTGKGN